MVLSFRSSASPLSSVNAVNDGSLPTNISEDAQQSSGTYVENSVMSVVTKKGFEERAGTVFERNSPNCSTMLVINFPRS